MIESWSIVKAIFFYAGGLRAKRRLSVTTNQRTKLTADLFRIGFHSVVNIYLIVVCRFVQIMVVNHEVSFCATAQACGLHSSAQSDSRHLHWLTTAKINEPATPFDELDLVPERSLTLNLYSYYYEHLSQSGWPGHTLSHFRFNLV